MNAWRFLACAALSMSSTAWGQAWAPPAGAGAATITYQKVNNNGHRLTDGSILRGYDSESQGILLEVEYAFTERFSMSVGLPYIFARYTGPEASFSGLDIDECHCWNHGWQDFNVTGRLNVTNGPNAFTPFVSIGIPSHEYSYFGEAVLGRNLKEIRFGLAAGQRLDPISPRLSLQERYSYAVAERVLGLSINRSNLSIDPAFQLTRKLSANASFAWQRTHGGLRGTEIVTEEQFVQYDRLVRDNNLQAGIGIAYSFPRVDLFASYVEYLDGTDTHDGNAVTFGVSWPFEWSR